MTRLRMLKIAFSMLFVFGVAVVYPNLPNDTAIETTTPETGQSSASSSKTPQQLIETEYAYQVERLTIDSSLVAAAPTATATQSTQVVTAAVSDEMQEKLDLALNQELDDTIYTTVEEYFGTDTSTGSLPEAPTVVVPTVAPTEAPTVAPTVAPTAAPTEAPTEAPTAEPTPTPEATEGETEGEADGTEDEDGATAMPTATAAPTPTATAAPTPTATVAPTAAPTPTPTAAQVPVITVTDSSLTGYAQISRYNDYFLAEYKTYTYAVSQAYGVSYELLVAIMYNESRFIVDATNYNTNGTTDRGLMQINDVCFSTLNAAIGLPSLDSLYDPGWNITSGAYLVYYYMVRYGYNELDALLCYQCGYTGAQSYFTSGNRPVSYTNVTTNLAIYQSANLT